MTTREKIERVIEQFPNLTAYGFTDYILRQNGRVLSPEEGEELIQRARESLLNSEQEFEKVCEWLKQIEKSDTIIKKANSESLARYAEKEIGCLNEMGCNSSGVFIAAAMHSGFKWERARGTGLQACFGMTLESIQATRGYRLYYADAIHLPYPIK